ncbi:hypothetical protein GALL_266540 [mine drainage metagenome]|uniref:Uncharacterized protein n=1 Tax=mine drainage metagenome TaxID=410659 RepID=A0A1J5R6C7_9ZZZZ
MLKSLLHRLLPSRPARRAAAPAAARALPPATGRATGGAPPAEAMPPPLRRALERASGISLALARRRLVEADDKRPADP